VFNFDNFYWFLSVSLLVNIAPGPDMLYTAARSLSQGIKAGIFSALGIFSGCLFHITAAVFGLSKIIEESVLLFSIIKYAGAAYLVYLGIRSLLSKKTMNEVGVVAGMSYRKIWLQGMTTNLLNPSGCFLLIFFAPIH
jgi:threonine/homoserine/homoserine lactone efflux protein